ncbi:hypothetical protein [uncultured Rothia sp.]|uniref:hypothetical protein n=1 Tax=uncultured Rothia sp. TaxID=316088 RepID=UPI0025E5EF67|nr:hypothetical protein [uncultured Rothia sp.]
MNPLETLLLARKMATGSPLLVEIPDFSPRCATDAEFDVLVTTYYKLLYEELSRDVAFLKSCRKMPKVKKAQRLLYVLRTAAQHSGNKDVVSEARKWRSGNSSPQSAANSLASTMLAAFKELASVAVYVSKSNSDSARWRKDLTVDTNIVFAGVVSDLGLCFSPNKQTRMVRLVQKRVEVQRPRGDLHTGTADYCVQEILSEHAPLPVPYQNVLDSLGLFGKPEAAGALLLAYSVAKVAPSLRGDAFLNRVEEMFQRATS